ncbi:MAG TPA: response regulator [Polyangia bacterium]
MTAGPGNPHVCGGVLIVDDDEGIRAALSQALADEGYPVLAAEHGAEALDVLRTSEPRPCLILLDMMMPVMDGRQFIERKLTDPSLRDVPVVVVTADGRAVKNASELAAADVLAKPISLDQLLLAVQRFCR